MPTYAVILAAAGRSSRYKDQHYKKPFAPLTNKPVWLHSAEKFLNRGDVKQLIVAVSPEDEQHFREKFGPNIAILGLDVVCGGEQRADTVVAALAAVREEIEYVAVHDAARPCLSEKWIDEVFQAAAATGAAILAAPVTATLKRIGEGDRIKETVDRGGLWEAQTPQVFRRQLLAEAYAQLAGRSPTDEAQALEWAGTPVTLVAASSLNIKITTREDLKLAEQILKVLPKPTIAAPGNPLDDMWR